MNLKRCENGHYYDPSKFSYCPECADKNSAPEIADYGATEPYDGGNVFGDPGVTMPAENDFIPVGGSSGGSVDVYNEQTGPAIIGEVAGFVPVTGWLVCVDGPERGKDYRIKPGYNYIGRDERMDICLRGDEKISRDGHAKIAYDDVEKIFFFGPERGADVVRVNGKLVMNQAELHPYDILSIGSIKLVFIPLCGDKFSWG